MVADRTGFRTKYLPLSGQTENLSGLAAPELNSPVGGPCRHIATHTRLHSACHAADRFFHRTSQPARHIHINRDLFDLIPRRSGDRLCVCRFVKLRLGIADKHAKAFRGRVSKNKRSFNGWKNREQSIRQRPIDPLRADNHRQAEHHPHCAEQSAHKTEYSFQTICHQFLQMLSVGKGHVILPSQFTRFTKTNAPYAQKQHKVRLFALRCRAINPHQVIQSNNHWLHIGF